MIRLVPRSMNARLVLLVCAVLFVSGALSGWITAKRQTAMLGETMRRDAAIMTRNFAESGVYYLVLNDYAGLEAFLLKSAELPDVARLRVCEPDGAMIADVEHKPGAQPLARAVAGSIAPPTDRAPAPAVGDDSMIIWEPIEAGTRLGWLRAEYSTAGIREAQLEIIRNSLALTAVWIAGSAFLLILILRPAVRAFGQLAVFARQLDEKKGVKITVHTRVEELDELAASLNYASHRLASTEQQLIRDRERLRASEGKYRQLLDTIQEGIWVIDKDSVTTFVNPRMAELIGYAPEEMIGKHLFSFMDDQGRKLAELNVERRKQGIKEAHDFEFIKQDGTRIFTRLETGPLLDEAGNYAGAIAGIADVTETRRLEQERAAHLHFLESMDKVNRAVQGTSDLEQMMNDVLGVVLTVMGGDRAYLVYPCDPNAASYRVPMERTTPEYPGALARGAVVPVDAEAARVFSAVLGSDDPVTFGPGSEAPLPPDLTKYFGVQSQAAMAVRPKIGKPYMFGVHQCSHTRIWTGEEVRLLREIGRRLADALSTLLANRELQESEQRYRTVFENSPVSIWEEDFSEVNAVLNGLKQNGITDMEAYLAEHPEVVRQCAERARIINVNQAALDLHGATTKQELLQGLVSTFTQESFETFRQELVCLWNGGTAMHADAAVKTLAGEPRQVTVYFTVGPGSEKTLGKVLVSLVDITERKQAEVALRKLSDELEERVKERTAALEAKIAEIERMNKMFIGRELRMMELKGKIRELEGARQADDGASG